MPKVKRKKPDIVSVKSGRGNKWQDLKISASTVRQLCDAIRLGADYHGMTFEDMAKKASVSAATAMHYYHGRVKEPSLRCSIHLLRAVGYQVDVKYVG